MQSKLTRLTNLDLSSNGISDTGATSLAKVIKVNKTLTDLDLSGDSIGDAGATSIVQAMKVKKTLTYLDLSCNGIIDSGATSIAQAKSRRLSPIWIFLAMVLVMLLYLLLTQ